MENELDLEIEKIFGKSQMMFDDNNNNAKPVKVNESQEESETDQSIEEFEEKYSEEIKEIINVLSI